MSENKELYLVLQKKWFLEILKGEKKEEYRDFTDYYINRLGVIDKDGELVDTKKYNTVRFQLGYTKNAPQIVLECNDVLFEIDNDAKEMNTENTNFVIVLGDILEKINCESLNI